MLRKAIRVLAILFLLGSIALGSFATYVYLTPSDEQILYDQKHAEATQKLKAAEAARGTSEESRFRKEAQDAAQSAALWGQGYRERVQSNRLGIIASAGIGFLSIVALLLTFVGKGNRSPMASVRH